MPREDLVSNAPLRDAFNASALNAHELAVHLGIMRRFSAPSCRDGAVIREGRWGGDATAVKRDLGLVPNTGRAKGTMRRQVTIAKALRYAEALGLDPAEVGL